MTTGPAVPSGPSWMCDKMIGLPRFDTVTVTLMFVRVESNVTVAFPNPVPAHGGVSCEHLRGDLSEMAPVEGARELVGAGDEIEDECRRARRQRLEGAAELLLDLGGGQLLDLVFAAAHWREDLP